MKRLISDKQIEAINRKWNCGGNGHFDWANEIEAVVRAEAEAKTALARRAMEAFTPAIDSVLWIAIMWNDHNFDADTIRAKAQRAKDALGLLRDGSMLPESEERERLFALWNAALTALKVGAGGTATEGHNAALTGGEAVRVEGTVMRGRDEH